MTRYCAACAAKDAEIQRLKDEVADWKAYRAPPPDMPNDHIISLRQKFGITPSGARILHQLMQHAGKAQDSATLLACSVSSTTRCKDREDVARNLLGVLICRVRAHLRAYGIDNGIINVFNVGYFITEDAARQIDAIIGGARVVRKEDLRNTGRKARSDILRSLRWESLPDHGLYRVTVRSDLLPRFRYGIALYVGDTPLAYARFLHGHQRKVIRQVEEALSDV